jgi:S-adenosylmethionine:tRNA-ribosyltransferase-isomerase (queuine synthetase)
MAEEIKKSSYYEENVPDLISDLKTAVTNNRKVITQDVTGELGEDKYVNVLKSRRMAADDTIHFLKEIDRLQNEINGVSVDENIKEKKSINPVSKFSKKN